MVHLPFCCLRMPRKGPVDLSLGITCARNDYRVHYSVLIHDTNLHKECDIIKETFCGGMVWNLLLSLSVTFYI